MEGGRATWGCKETAARAKAVGEGDVGGGDVGEGRREVTATMYRGSFRGFATPRGAHAVARSSALIRRDQPLSSTWLSLSADILIISLIVYTFYNFFHNDPLLVLIYILL